MRISNASRLTPRKINSLKPRDKRYRVADGGAPAGGLLLEVRPSGGKSWLSRLSLPVWEPADAGASDDPDAPELTRRVRRIDMTLGQWPAMPIEQARAAHLDALRHAEAGR